MSRPAKVNTVHYRIGNSVHMTKNSTKSSNIGKKSDDCFSFYHFLDFLPFRFSGLFFRLVAFFGLQLRIEAAQPEAKRGHEVHETVGETKVLFTWSETRGLKELCLTIIVVLLTCCTKCFRQIIIL